MRFKQYDDKWTICNLSDIAIVVGGGTPDTTDSLLWNGNVQWFTPTEVGHSKYVSKSVRTISQLGLQKSSAKMLPKGSILLSSRATVGECSIAKHECTTNQGFQSLIPKKGINNEFLYYLTQTKKKHFIKYASGSTFLEISNSEIKKTKCAVPCIEEQAKIAELLSLLDEKIETQNKIIKNKKSLIISLIIEILLSVLSLVESFLSLNLFSMINNLLKLLWTIFKEVKRIWSKKKT
ncbi:MAG: restriction endonuclease subunit S [Clostridiales bacterium]|nr:restriction endonuclease subunit S [Clostridiales bacterium]